MNRCEWCHQRYAGDRVEHLLYGCQTAIDQWGVVGQTKLSQLTAAELDARLAAIDDAPAPVKKSKPTATSKMLTTNWGKWAAPGRQGRRRKAGPRAAPLYPFSERGV